MSENKNQKNESHGIRMHVVIEQFFPKDGKTDDIIKIAKESAKGIYGVQGLLMAQVLSPKSKKGPVCNITSWQSEQDFNKFMKSDEVKELHKSDMMKNVQDWSSDININMFQLEDGWHQ
jgi:heme-degrading monooxygenase HmoA